MVFCLRFFPRKLEKRFFPIPIIVIILKSKDFMISIPLGTGLAGSTGTGPYSPPGSTGTGFAEGGRGSGEKSIYGTVTSDTNYGSVDTNYFSSNT